MMIGNIGDGRTTCMYVETSGNTALRVVLSGTEIVVTSREIMQDHEMLDTITDFAVNELRNLKDRLSDFAKTLDDHGQDGVSAAGCDVAQEAETFCRDHIKLTRRYWRTHDLGVKVRAGRVRVRDDRRKEELWRVAFARRVRLQVHLRNAKLKLRPRIAQVVAVSTSDTGSTVAHASNEEGFLDRAVNFFTRCILPFIPFAHTPKNRAIVRF